MGRPLPPQTRSAILAAVEAGLPYSVICDSFQVSKNCVSQDRRSRPDSGRNETSQGTLELRSVGGGSGPLPGPGEKAHRQSGHRLFIITRIWSGRRFTGSGVAARPFWPPFSDRFAMTH